MTDREVKRELCFSSGSTCSPHRGDGICHLQVREAYLPKINEEKFILELVDMQSSITMPQEIHTKGAAQFWSDVNINQSSNVKKAAVMMLSMFGLTYT